MYIQLATLTAYDIDYSVILWEENDFCKHGLFEKIYIIYEEYIIA
jgi:hypothetical protein